MAFVYDAVYPFSKGGAERRYYELARALVACGYDVHWYGMRYWPGPRDLRLDGMTLHGVCRARPLYTRSGRRSILQALIFGIACVRMLRQRHDVIDCSTFPFFALPAARLAAAAHGARLLVTWHEVWGLPYWRSYLGLAGVVGYLVEWGAARAGGRRVVVSERTGHGLRARLGARTASALVPNGVDVRAISAVEPRPHGCEVVYAGRLCDFKDVELLLDALALVRSRRPGTRCLLVGDGPHRQALEQRVRSLGLETAVVFDGFVATADEVYARIAAARVLVQPSRREGFGIVVLEANAVGVPAVVVAHPDNAARDLVEPGVNGLVVPPQPQPLADAVLEVLDSAAARWSARCREAARRFDWATVARSWEAVAR